MKKFDYTLGKNLLTVNDLSLTINNTLVLNEVNIEIPNINRPDMNQGQVIGFLGPSGIGKTRFFNALAGLEQLKSNSKITGEILLGDPGVPVKHGMVSVVAQDYPLLKRRTVLSNLVFGSQRSGKEKSEAVGCAWTMLDRLEMTDKAKLYPSQLSGGQRQRIAIAQQMLRGGHFLLMDEPFTGLDRKMKKVIFSLIHEFATTDSRNTVVVVTHEIPDAITVSDTLWLMGRDTDDEGEVIPGAKIQHVYDLKKRGLAWTPDLSSKAEFFEFDNEVGERFDLLN